MTTRRIVPGPGNYDVRSNMSMTNGIKFAHAGRSFYSTDNNPGPGAYRVPVKIANVPNYIIQG